MALVIRTLYNYYNYFFHEFEDPRVKHYPLLQSPIPVFTILVLYLAFVLKWGPEYMKNRKPYDLRNVIKAYNLLQVIFNIYFGIYALWNSYLRRDFSWTCQPCDTTNTNLYMRKLIFAGYLYYVNKYVDLLDTVFFILRKKNNQATFLHIYHHAGMVFGVYIYMKFMAGSHPTLLGVLNAFVHFFMYGYYFISSLGEDYSKKYAWCKKYITQIQLIQFAILVAHFTTAIVKNGCTFPKFISSMAVIQNGFMFILFFDFYYKTYIMKKNK